MANARLMVDHIDAWEGGRSSHPNDNALRYGHSGILMKVYEPDNKYANYPIHTNKGVIWGTYVSAMKKLKRKVSAKDFCEMTKETWYWIFKTMFWDSVMGDKIKSQGIAEILTDAAWGGGGMGMVRFLQRYLIERGAKLQPDGVIGDKTIAALNSIINTKKEEEELINALSNQRLSYLRSLSDWGEFGNGWTNRVNALKAKALAVVSSPAVQIGGLLVFGTIAYFVYKNYTGKTIKILA